MPVARLVVAALFTASSALAFAQAQKAPAYEPSVGQEGKDVVWVPTPQALVDKMLDMAKVTDKDFVMDPARATAAPSSPPPSAARAPWASNTTPTWWNFPSATRRPRASPPRPLS
jgi:hypothetical protein